MACLKKGLATPLRRGETVAIAIESEVDPLPEEVLSLWGRIASMGQYNEGPSLLSEPMRIVDADGVSKWLFVIDPKGLSAKEATSIPHMLLQACEEASLDDTVITRQDWTQRFTDVVVPHALVVAVEHTMAPYESTVAVREALAPLLAGLVEDLTDRAAPAVVAGGTLIDVQWDLIHATNGALLHPEFPNSVIVALNSDKPDSRFGACTTELAQPKLTIAGPDLRTAQSLRTTAGQLREALRDLPPGINSTVITVLDETEARALPNPKKWQQADRYYGHGNFLNDIFLPALGWSTTMTPQLWDQVSENVTATGAEVTRLEDGRVEVTFGDIADWAPWLGERSGPTVESAENALRPILARYHEYEEAASRRASQQRNARKAD